MTPDARCTFLDSLLKRVISNYAVGNPIFRRRVTRGNILGKLPGRSWTAAEPNWDPDHITLKTTLKKKFFPTSKTVSKDWEFILIISPMKKRSMKMGQSINL